MLRYAVGSASTEEREAGFLEVMRRDFPGIDLISTEQHAGATRDTAKRASENLLSRYGGEVGGIFASNESAASGMLSALRDAGLAGGKVKFVGFDSGEPLNAARAAGDVQGLVVQDPVKMGYLGVKTVVAVLRGEKVPALIDTGVGLVTPENMNEPGPGRPAASGGRIGGLGGHERTAARLGHSEELRRHAGAGERLSWRSRPARCTPSSARTAPARAR